MWLNTASVHFFTITDPSLGGVSHSRSNFFSLMLIFFFVPLLFEEPHFFGKFKGVNILEQLLDIGVMGCLKLRVLVFQFLHLFAMLLL
jgi:hypothetical protein